MSTPVIVCPHAGATSAAYRHWKQAAGDLRVHPLDRPGRGTGPRSQGDLTDLPTVVASSVQAVEKHLPTGQGWVALGHSFGTAMAVAVSSRLQALGAGPDLVVLSCGRAPTHQETRDHVAELDDDQLNQHLLGLGETTLEVLDGPLGGIIRRYYRQDQALRAQVASGAVPLTLTCPVLTVSAMDDPHVRHEAVRAWGEHTSGAHQHLEVDGGHFSVVHDPGPVLTAVRTAMAGVSA